jgi:uncharacterized iron-regulated protein
MSAPRDAIGVLRRVVCAALLAPLTACVLDRPAAQPASQRPACLAPAEWYALGEQGPRKRDAAALFSELASREVVLLGESHDDADHHRWQLQTLAALHALRPSMAIGFEAFPRRVQPVLDRWVAGELSQKEFLAQADWDRVWNFPADLYLPLLHFARLNRIPLRALNVERDLTQAISREGWDAVPAAKKEGVSRPAPASAEYRTQLLEVYQQHRRDKHAGPARIEDPEFRHFVDSQLTWDRAMAEGLASARRAARDGEAPLVVGILGAGHVRHGYGVARQLRDLGVARVASLLPVDALSDCAELTAGLADAVFALAELPGEQPAPPRLGVQLEQKQDGVIVADVVAGSLAEATGLRKGDRLASLAGKPVSQVNATIAAIRAQPDGTWLPLQVRRGDDTIELLVKFPPKR